MGLCELENAPEMQKCPKTFVHDCRPDALPLGHKRPVGVKATKLGSCDKHAAYC